MKQDDIFPGFATSLEMILKQEVQKLLQQAIETEQAKRDLGKTRFELQALCLYLG